MWLLGDPVALVFRNPVALFSIAGTAFAGTAFIVNAVAGDDDATWLEGGPPTGVHVVPGHGGLSVVMRAVVMRATARAGSAWGRRD